MVWCVCVCVCMHMHLNVHVACVQDVTKQLEGLAKHLRASGKKPDSPHTQLALIGSSQAVLLVRKLSLGISVQGQWWSRVGHCLLMEHLIYVQWLL